MILEIELENGLIERKSDKGVYIKNEQIGYEYSAAIDIPNEERKKRGLEPYTYIETERAIEEEPTSGIDAEIIAKARAYDLFFNKG